MTQERLNDASNAESMMTRFIMETIKERRNNSIRPDKAFLVLLHTAQADFRDMSPGMHCYNNRSG